MDKIPFFKMSGSGNDFIVIDNRSGRVTEEDLRDWIVHVCRRKMSAGADGLILVEPSSSADFKWRFYNADGSRAEMCGNGARCAARFAYLQGVAGERMAFETDAGRVSARIAGERVRIGLTDPRDLQIDVSVELAGGRVALSRVNTGVPHAVVLVEDAASAPVFEMGRELRYHQAFAPAGTNVNFLQAGGSGPMVLRTYERGVEDETLACGTGAAACALVAARKFGVRSPVDLQTRSGGVLTIHFRRDGDAFSGVALEGDARVIYTAELWPDAWAY